MKTKDGHNYFFGGMPEMPWKRRIAMPETIYRPRPDCQIHDLGWIYSGIFGFRRDGSFVEIGAHDGISWSNTVFLAELGWTGLYVEPIEHLWVKCVENHKAHPKVTVFNAAVGDGSDITIWQNGDTDYLFTGNPKFAKLNSATKETGKFHTITMDMLLELYKFKNNFELAVIDVEGMEVDVLKGWTIERWMPKLVIIETHELNPNAEMAERTEYINNYFAPYYAKIYTSAINTIFLRVYA